MVTHLVGLDLGQSVDYSAASVLRRVWAWPGHIRGTPFVPGTEQLHHEVVALLRWQLGTAYTEIVDNVMALVGRVKSDLEADQVVLVVDSSGVGRPVVDLLRQNKLTPRAVTITGGSSVGEREDDMTVPKEFIASSLIVAAQNGTLKVASSLSFAKELEKEIGSFGYKVNRKSATVSYESLQDQVHDDLVIACALPLWYSTSRLSQRFTGASMSQTADSYAKYNPLA